MAQKRKTSDEGGRQAAEINQGNDKFSFFKKSLRLQSHIKMTETFNYKQIREEYGINVLQQIRTLENISKKKGRYTGHLHFYLQCKHKDLTPKGIKIKAQMSGNEARKIIEKAEKALLNVRISEVVRKNNLLDLKKSRAVELLKEKLPDG